MKKIIVTPAGRERYLKTLKKYIEREKGTFDEWHLWLNTNVQSDIDYCNSIENDWIKIQRLPNINTVSSMNIHKFFQFAKDPDAVYIRLDDDIVFLEPGFFTKLFQTRIDNPEPFLIYPNIINNSIVSHLHQRNKLFTIPGIITYTCMDKEGWKNPNVAEALHRAFIQDVKDGQIEKWKTSFRLWDLWHYERVSINCVSWLGSVFENLTVGADEEQWLSCEKPSRLKKANLLVHEPICVHFSFFTQREHLDKTDILEQYDSLV
jgi:hypothetical protein